MPQRQTKQSSSPGPWVGKNAGGGGGGAPTTASYLTVADESLDLPDARFLTAGANILLHDNGPGADLIIACTAGGVGIHGAGLRSEVHNTPIAAHATGDDSFAIGLDSVATGSNSFAGGSNCLASGTGAFAMGLGSRALASQAFCEGYACEITAAYGHAEEIGRAHV